MLLQSHNSNWILGRPWAGPGRAADGPGRPSLPRTRFLDGFLCPARQPWTAFSALQESSGRPLGTDRKDDLAAVQITDRRYTSSTTSDLALTLSFVWAFKAGKKLCWENFMETLKILHANLEPYSTKTGLSGCHQ